MSGINLSRETLQHLSTTPDKELVLRQGEGDDKARLYTQEGWWGGRLVRNIKIGLGEDRTTQQDMYGGAKQAVLDSLKKIYGDDIGEKAFWAGVGHEDSVGMMETSTNHPLAGRHIAKMLRAGDELMAQQKAQEFDFGRLGRGGEVPLHPVSVIEGRFGRTMDTMHDEVVNRLVTGQEEHAFWMLDLGLRNGDTAQLGIYASRDNPEMLFVRDTNGDQHAVERDRLDEWLRDRFGTGGDSSVKLYRAISKAENELRFENSDDREIKFSGSGGEIGDIDDSFDEPSKNKQIEDRLTDFENRVEDDVDEPVDDTHVQPQTPLPKMRFGVLWVGELLSQDQWKQMHEDNKFRLERDHEERDSWGPSKSLDLRLGPGKAQMYVSNGGGRPEWILSGRDVRVGQVGVDIGRPIVLDDEQAKGLTRFVNDRIFLDTFSNVVGRLGLDPRPDPDRVDVSIQGRRDSSGDPEGFDITFRARVPDNLQIPTDHGSIPGSGYDLTMTVSVPYDQVTAPQPNIQFSDPRIIRR